MSYKRILVATDGSSLSKKAVAAAIDQAVMSGATLVALNVVPRYAAAMFEGGVVMPVDDIARVEQQWTDSAQKVLDDVSKSAEAEGVSCKTVVVKSDLVAESIVKAASKHKCDLIVMASHGRKGLKRILLGSETLAVLTHSHVPVLVLR